MTGDRGVSILAGIQILPVEQLRLVDIVVPSSGTTPGHPDPFRALSSQGGAPEDLLGR